jgi:integrase/recombinase XerC
MGESQAEEAAGSGTRAPAVGASVGDGTRPVRLALTPDSPDTHEPTAGDVASRARSGEPDAAALLRQLADGFFARYAGTTLRTYRGKLRMYGAWCGVPLDALPAALLGRGAVQVHVDVERYRAHLRDERRASPATINGHLAALRSLVRFLRRVHACAWTLDVPSERATAYRDTAGPGLRAAQALLRAAARQPDARKAARDVALVRLMTDRALRRGEVVGLDVEHVVPGDDGAGRAGSPRAVLVQAKGKREREPLTLPPKTAAALAAWLAARGDAGGPLFIALDPGAGRAGRRGRTRGAAERLTGEGVARVLAALGVQAGLGARVRPHGLRHTAITALLDAGAGLREAQRFSRHADPRTLMRYDDNRSDIGGEMARRVSDLM